MATATQSSEAARRYANALFELAQDKGQLADVHDAFGRFATLVRDSKDLTRLIQSPLFSRENKAEILTRVATQASLPDLLGKFLGTIAMNGRAADLPATAAAFDELYAKQRGVQRAVARTAKPMTDAQRKRIEDIIAKSHGGDVDLTTEVDESLIGGLQLRIGSTLIDASLKAKLERLNSAMKGA
ncbi:MAG: ATP synthase F1 subunit delta [Pseudomonadota bacterium]